MFGVRFSNASLVLTGRVQNLTPVSIAPAFANSQLGFNSAVLEVSKVWKNAGHDSRSDTVTVYVRTKPCPVATLEVGVEYVLFADSVRPAGKAGPLPVGAAVLRDSWPTSPVDKHEDPETTTDRQALMSFLETQSNASTLPPNNRVERTRER
jgi:hypothetical protein